MSYLTFFYSQKLTFKVGFLNAIFTPTQKLFIQLKQSYINQ